MKKLSLLLLAALSLSTASMVAQNKKGSLESSISVSGTGKASVVPDQVVLTLGVVTQDPTAVVAKTDNDKAIASVLKYLQSLKIESKNIQTQVVSLDKRQDYQTKEFSYVASQDIVVNLMDVGVYETLIAGVMNQGVNSISNVTFKTSKTSELEKQTRILAVENARTKAEQYANALGQELGKAITVQEQGQGGTFPVARANFVMKMEDDSADQTLAVGEIQVVSSVSITFELK